MKEEKLNNFISIMKRELIKNSYKGDWEEYLDDNDMIKELYYHLNKLENSLKNNDVKWIEEHIADCSNILLFIGNSKNLY